MSKWKEYPKWSPVFHQNSNDPFTSVAEEHLKTKTTKTSTSQHSYSANPGLRFATTKTPENPGIFALPSQRKAYKEAKKNYNTELFLKARDEADLSVAENLLSKLKEAFPNQTRIIARDPDNDFRYVTMLKDDITEGSIPLTKESILKSPKTSTSTRFANTGARPRIPRTNYEFNSPMRTSDYLAAIERPIRKSEPLTLQPKSVLPTTSTTTTVPVTTMISTPQPKLSNAAAPLPAIIVPGTTTPLAQPSVTTTNDLVIVGASSTSTSFTSGTTASLGQPMDTTVSLGGPENVRGAGVESRMELEKATAVTSDLPLESEIGFETKYTSSDIKGGTNVTTTFGDAAITTPKVSDTGFDDPEMTTYHKPREFVSRPSLDTTTYYAARYLEDQNLRTVKNDETEGIASAHHMIRLQGYLSHLINEASNMLQKPRVDVETVNSIINSVYENMEKWTDAVYGFYGILNECRNENYLCNEASDLLRHSFNKMKKELNQTIVALNDNLFAKLEFQDAIRQQELSDTDTSPIGSPQLNSTPRDYKDHSDAMYTAHEDDSSLTDLQNQFENMDLMEHEEIKSKSKPLSPLPKPFMPSRSPPPAFNNPVSMAVSQPPLATPHPPPQAVPTANPFMAPNESYNPNVTQAQTFIPIMPKMAQPPMTEFVSQPLPPPPTTVPQPTGFEFMAPTQVSTALPKDSGPAATFAFVPPIDQFPELPAHCQPPVTSLNDPFSNPPVSTGNLATNKNPTYSEVLAPHLAESKSKHEEYYKAMIDKQQILIDYFKQQAKLEAEHRRKLEAAAVIKPKPISAFNPVTQPISNPSLDRVEQTNIPVVPLVPDKPDKLDAIKNDFISDPRVHELRNTHFKIPNINKNPAHLAPKRTLKVLKSNASVTEFNNFWTIFEETVETTSKSWTDIFMTLHEHLDENLKKILDSMIIPSDVSISDKEKMYDKFYFEAKLEIFDRHSNDNYVKAETDIENLPDLKQVSDVDKFYEYRNLLNSLKNSGIAVMDQPHDGYFRQIKMKLAKTGFIHKYHDFINPSSPDSKDLPDNLTSLKSFIDNQIKRKQQFNKLGYKSQKSNDRQNKPSYNPRNVSSYKVDTTKPIQPQTTSSYPAYASQSTSQSSKPPPYSTLYCPYCKFTKQDRCDIHNLIDCPKFEKISFQDRKQFARKGGICYHCLKYHNDPPNLCKFKKNCNKCNYQHHPLLHNPNHQKSTSYQKSNDVKQTSDKPKEVKSFHASLSAYTGQMTPHVLPVMLTNKKTKKSVPILVFLDVGTDNTILNMQVGKNCDLVGEEDLVRLTTINKSDFVPCIFSDDFQLSSMDHKTTANIRVAAMDFKPDIKVIDPVEVQHKHDHLKNIQFPTYEAALQNGLSMILGRDHWDLLCPIKSIKGPPGSPIAIQYPLGWSLSMPVSSSGEVACFKVDIERLNPNMIMQRKPESYIEEIAKTEYIGCETKETKFSPKEERTQQRMLDSMKIEGNEIEMAMPMNEKVAELTNNYHAVLKRQAAMEKRLTWQDIEHLWQLFQKQLDKGFIVELDDVNPDKGFKNYLSYFVVEKDSITTPRRAVYNSKIAIGSKVPFNEAIDDGPDYQNCLFDMMVNFRIHDTAFIADVSSMYSMIRLPKEQWDLNRFVFRPPGESDWRTFTHVRWWFGCKTAPSAVQLALITRAKNLKDQYPIGAEIVLNHRYMDDTVCSMSGIQHCIKGLLENNAIYEHAGMQVQKVLSNKKEVMLAVPIEQRMKEYSGQGPLPTSKVLGYPWDPGLDMLTVPAVKIENMIPNTKRKFLAILSTVYDPLGFCSPYTVSSRRLLQRVWLAGTDWDDPLPDHIQRDVDCWYQQLDQLDQLKIKRQVIDEPIKAIHIFADSSKEAFGVVAYATGETKSYILVSKGRVHTIKPMGIPRKELIAAVLATKIGKSLRNVFPETPMHYWSDSQNVLCWIHNDSKLFKPFVANRVAYIHERTETSQWHYVPTKLNPADLTSRGSNMKDLIDNEFWLHGPKFLYDPETPWPKQKQYGFPTDAEELSKEEVKQIFSFYIRATDLPVIENFDKLSDLIDSMIMTLRKRNNEDGNAPISVEEHETALIELIKIAQEEGFADELASLRANQSIKRRSKVFKLCPKLDTEKNILRLDTRLSYSESLPYDTKYPILLPKSHHLTKLLILHFDKEIHHTYGTNYLVHKLREKYWVPAARQAVKKARKECIECQKQHAKAAPPKESPLPTHRVNTPVRPFQSTGVDFTGFYLTKQGRGIPRIKRYGCFFTCTATRAVHFEVAESLETSAFLDCLARFTSRRGIPRDIFSDNGTNFVGADREVKQLVQQMNHDEIQNYARTKGFTWHFNPPNSPHFGGIFESMIKSGKKAIKAILQNSEFTDLELVTAFALAEDMLNGRPLMFMTDDPGDFQVLTPSMFLHGQLTGQVFPSSIDTTTFDPRTRWRYVQKCLNDVWKRWLKELLPSLGPRSKWINDSREYEVNDQVLIISKDLPRNKWVPARITAVYPGRDQRVRVVDVESEQGIFQTSVHRLIPLT